MPSWFHSLSTHFPNRYLPWLLSAVGLLLCAFTWVAFGLGGWGVLGFGALVGLGAYDVRQTGQAVWRNYPVIGHLYVLRRWLDPAAWLHPPGRGAVATPFSPAQRALVERRARGEPELRAYGSAAAMAAPGHEWLNHSLTPTTLPSHDFRVLVGADCAQPYSASVFNISAMSFGALSAAAILALNAGARRGGFAHDTGEGGISPYHHRHGGDLIWQIGSGYFGCRRPDGGFDPERFAEQARQPQVKLIELKLSQGAQPGHGDLLPAAKVTAEIAGLRGVAAGVDCVSPARHSAFATPIELMQFIERLRELSGGKPTGLKLCIGHPWEWLAIAKAIAATGIAPDFIAVDGAEGGTGAAPAELTDHAGWPLDQGLRLVHNTLVGLGLRERIRLAAAGKVVSGFDVARLMALGADWCNSARGFMFALGCVQAQTCHTSRCPTGVTTQDPLRQHALVVPDKAERVFQFHQNTLRALKTLVEAAGLNHPGEITADHLMRRVSAHDVLPFSRLYGAVPPGALRAEALRQDPLPLPVFQDHWQRADAASFGPR